MPLSSLKEACETKAFGREGRNFEGAMMSIFRVLDISIFRYFVFPAKKSAPISGRTPSFSKNYD